MVCGMKRFGFALAAPTLITAPVMAEKISFSNWKHKRLSLFSANKYSFGSSTFGVNSEGAVSIAWTRLSDGAWDANKASWTWNETQSLPATNLSRKGGMIATCRFILSSCLKAKRAG